MQRYFLSIKGFFLLALTMALTALLISGCGDSNSEGSAGEITVEASSLSKEEFIKRADAVCNASKKKLDLELAAYFRTNPQPRSQAGQETWLREFAEDVFLPIHEKRIDEISAIGAPSDDADEVATILNAFQQRLKAIRARPVEFSRVSEPFAKPVKMATAYGLNGCAATYS